MSPMRVPLAMPAPLAVTVNGTHAHAVPSAASSSSSALPLQRATSAGNPPKHHSAYYGYSNNHAHHAQDMAFYQQRAALADATNQQLHRRQVPKRQATLAEKQYRQLQLQQQELQRQLQRQQLQYQQQIERQRQQQQQQLQTLPSPTRQQAPPKVEWRVAVDPKSKRPYYYHPVTRETTWKKPQELVEKEKWERAQFFASMENNIRAKLRAGNWFRESLTSRPGDLDDATLAEEGELVSPDTASTRSSWSSVSAANKMQCTSMPTTPEATLQTRSNQEEEEFDEAEAAMLAAADEIRPRLFRTLSSYETPVIGETKTLEDGRVVSFPSPIRERVRLAVMNDEDEELFMPRASDVESYTQPVRHSLVGPTMKTLSTSTASPSGGPMRAPLRRRSNSTSTIFVRMGTMNAPDQDTTIQCVATVLRAHLMEAQAAPIVVDVKFARFVNRHDQDANLIPSLKEIGLFMKHIFARAQMESECIIMSLIYVERLLKATMGSLQLQPANWRSILFCSMVMASKVWDDLSMSNADFSKIWPELTLKEINDLELTYLSAVEYNVRVSAVSYAKYYFHLRSMCASMGMLAAFDESAPLNLDGARKMQVLSEEYQKRSKMNPAPRRRSVTITTPSAESRAAEAAAKASPAASLEQLVHMEVRSAGGGMLSLMHRLSSSSSPSSSSKP
ncbi:hypothetical protein Poli38472_003931 [Pythium oligandrum]|uniref:WW domain-containing protein n=1 Tax=Pythium oligandrum TaxID=41045 RepID=A0A8K1FKK8_PYTOL|nr:hypothetical protein Poli38472_003931 [Pythium oligandrum]|eukprot:TMW66166.1 hypothetical protein Poli38472_003931 [Pythium oligandrum]